MVQIDTSGEGVRATTASGQVFQADRALLTVPIKVLQDERITFVPPLPEANRAAIAKVEIPHGLKVFLRFEERFYPDLLLDGGLLSDGATDKLYYNAAFRKDSKQHVLALFWVAHAAKALTSLDDAAIGQAVLAELDARFAGKATPRHQGHVVQNWSAEPWIRGAYSVGFGDARSNVITTLRAPVAGRLFFSGEALSQDNWSTVPGAMESAYDAVAAMLAG